MARALALWVEITGVEPAKYGSGSMSDWRIRTLHENIQEALDLDPTEITAFYILNVFAANYFKDRTFSLLTLLDAPERVHTYLEKSHELRAILGAPEVIERGEEFAATLSKAVERYDGLTPEVKVVINDREEIGFLRRDALRSIKNLRVDQFLRGAPEPDGRKPVYNKVVHQFINVNSLLAAAVDMPAGVSLNLIRHPDGYQSYFVFTIRNGGNVFFLSDTPPVTHPLQGDMMSQRRPDRQLEGRSFQNWFPYDLLDIAYNDNGDLYIVPDYMKDPSSSLVPYQSKLHPLTFINKLEPRQVIWLTMMFDLIVEKFWHEGHQAPVLSYTGEMLKVASPLALRAEEAGHSVALYDPLALEPLVLDDVLAGSSLLTEDTVGEACGANQWLEDRFKDRVAADIDAGMNLLNLAGLPETKILLASNVVAKVLAEKKRDDKIAQIAKDRAARGETGPVSIVYETDTSDGLNDEDQDARSNTGAVALIPQTHGIVVMDDKDRKGMSSFRWDEMMQSSATLAKIDTTRFGTRESISNDRVFIARHNVAKRIQQLAVEEYAERKAEVEAWVKDKMRANAANLYEMAIMGEVRKPYRRTDTKSYRLFAETNTIEHMRNNSMYGSFGAITLSGPSSFSYFGPGKGAHTCFETDGKATYLTVFRPHYADELALLCGCEVADLPDVLQHWTSETPTSTGNQILSRQDPMDWALRNPWCKSNFALNLYLSVRAINRLCKLYPESANLAKLKASA